jgi:hypothetical protein
MKAFEDISRVRRKLSMVSAAVASFVGLAVWICWPPAKWAEVEVGMTRLKTYSLVGQPHANRESLKGGVHWRRDTIVGRWELDVFFRADDSVGAFGRRWRWNGC